MKILISNFIKIRLVGAKWFDEEVRAGGRTDRQTDMAKLVVAFRNLTNAPNKFSVLPTQCIYVFCVDLRTKSDNFPIQP